jgi:N-acetylneuraminate synthase
MKVRIGNKDISHNNRPYFIADIAANHDGDINRAYRLIELAKEAGADAAKFQNFSAATIVSRSGFDKLGNQSHQSSWSKSVYEVYEDASIADYWTKLLKEKCDSVGIEYMTSPYDFHAVDLVEPYINAYKIGSGDITWIEMLEYIAKKNKPVLLATGASKLSDVDRAFKAVKKYTDDIILMQCNTNYTATSLNFQYINLNVLNTYAECYPDCILGLSDHTFGHTTVLGAIALGARVIEKHFTDDNNRIGPDHKFSMNPKTWREMVNAANDLFLALGDGIKRIEDNEKESVVVQQRSLYVNKDLLNGSVIKKEDIIPLRPIKSDGIPPYESINIIGRKINKDMKADSYIRWDDINYD